jgi:hypothetical protein
MSRGKYAGQPLTFHCPACFVMDKTRRTVGAVRLTGREKKRRSGGINHHGWGKVAYEYRCSCGHIGWSRHPDLERLARLVGT